MAVSTKNNFHKKHLVSNTVLPKGHFNKMTFTKRIKTILLIFCKIQYRKFNATNVKIQCRQLSCKKSTGISYKA